MMRRLMLVLGLTVPGWGMVGVVEQAAAPVLEYPVLLVPGWFDTERDLAALRIRLLGAGWPGTHVRTMSFERPTGSNMEHAAEIDSVARELLSVTGSDAIDIVAHSMGGLGARWFLRESPAVPVRRAVFIATPHKGTYAAHFAWGDGRPEMMPGSEFLETLNAAPPVPQGVEAITIRTIFDTHIIPGESASLPGVPEHRVCCPSHQGLLHDEDVFRIVHQFLEGGQ